MSKKKESSLKIMLGDLGAWLSRSLLVRSGVGAAVGAGIVIGLMEIGSIWRDVETQRERLISYEESHKADMERINEKNAAQDEKLAEYRETQVKILANLEQQGKTLTRLETKVDSMDAFLRAFLLKSNGSASLDEEGSAENVPARMSI